MTRILILLLAGGVVGAPTAAWAQLEPSRYDSGVVGVGLALRRLATTRSVLFVTAHPDDERSGLLTYLSLGKGYRVGIVTLTRGAGGQNEIGPELGEALSVLRTEELRSVHRLDRVEQYFGRVVDFGYSFSVEETLEKWGHEESLGDLVRVFREFRPDVVMTMRPDGAGGGQHHQASARLAAEAFRLAGDGERFPEHLDVGLRPWRPRQLYIAPFRLLAGEADKALFVPVGEFDALLGTSYAEFGAQARNFHRCQGMNAPPQSHNPPAFVLAVEPPVQVKLFAGLSPDLAHLEELWREGSWPALAEVEKAHANAGTALRAHDIGAVSEHIFHGLGAIRRCREAARATDARDLEFLLAHEEREWSAAAEAARMGSCSSLVVAEEGAARVPDGLVVPGETFVVESVVSAGRPGVTASLLVPPRWTVTQPTSVVDLPSKAVVERSHVTVGADAPYTQPFWHRASPMDGRYDTRGSASNQALPFAPAPVVVRFTHESGGVSSTFDRAVLHRWYDPVVGMHRTHTIKVVPPVAVEVEPRTAVVALGSTRSRQIAVTITTYLPDRSEGDRGAVVRLEAPEGFRVSPERVELQLGSENSEQRVVFEVAPPADLETGRHTLRVSCELQGRRYDQGFQAVSYHHIERQQVYRAAIVTLHAFEVKIAQSLRVGYVMGVGDGVPGAIVELGAQVTLLGEDDLAVGDLSRYDVVVLGVRAYKDRIDLRSHNDRLLEYVRAGGTVITQYNKYEFNEASFGPYPCKIYRPHDRVTDENAPVRILEPGHSLLNRPNRIGPADWEGWVQERGLYFLGEWDDRYEPLLEIADPFPFNPKPKRGALVVARYGKGLYIYTGLAFFRQLPAGVPGAYRLFANLLSGNAVGSR